MPESHKPKLLMNKSMSRSLLFLKLFYNYFLGLKNLSNASYDDLKDVIGAKSAKAVFDFFNSDDTN